MITFKKLILDELKALKRFDIISKIKSITYKTYSGGCSVDVDTVDLLKADREYLQALLSQYQEGSFDGMQDLYEYKSEPSTKIRTAKYIFLNNSFSEDVKALAKAKLASEGITNDDESQAKRRCWYDQAIWRELQAMGQGEV